MNESDNMGHLLKWVAANQAVGVRSSDSLNYCTYSLSDLRSTQSSLQ